MSGRVVPLLGTFYYLVVRSAFVMKAEVESVRIVEYIN